VKIGFLTGGGDCPGLNPALRGAVIRGLDFGHEMIGFTRGWAGIVEGDAVPLNLATVEDLINKGGTMLLSSRTNPFKKPEALQSCRENFKKFGLDALIALGGEDTLGVAHRLFKEYGLPTVGVPKTMDNDLEGTDYTFGFDSATEVAVEAADRLKDTARSHSRFMVLEVMGRHAGWVALETAVAAGADWVFIPEVPCDIQEMIAALQKKLDRGKRWGLVVVSEGAEIECLNEKDCPVDAFGHVILKDRGVGQFIAEEIEKHLKVETRFSVLGHIVRGGAPTAFDRWLATRVGIKAMEIANAGKFGYMACLRGTQVEAVPLETAVSHWKVVPKELYQEVLTLFQK